MGHCRPCKNHVAKGSRINCKGHIKLKLQKLKNTKSRFKMWKFGDILYMLVKIFLCDICGGFSAVDGQI